MTAGLDADGYVVPDVSLGHVRPPYDSVPPVTARLVGDNFAGRVHSSLPMGAVASNAPSLP
jgi:hypothetical protein